MRQTPFGVWNGVTTRCGRVIRGWSFNEADAFRRLESNAARRRRHSLQCFNEADAFRRLECLQRARARYEAIRFNEADAFRRLESAKERRAAEEEH